MYVFFCLIKNSSDTSDRSIQDPLRQVLQPKSLSNAECISFKMIFAMYMYSMYAAICVSIEFLDEFCLY